jgi:hypothetical protein
MDPIAESLARADEEDLQHHSAKGANLGATAIMCRWRRRAVESFGEDSDMVGHYDAILQTLREQRDRIDHLDTKAMAEALVTSKEIKSKYGNKSEREITTADHLKALEPNGPRQ